MRKMRKKIKIVIYVINTLVNILNVYNSIYTIRPSFSKQDINEEAQSWVINS